MTSFLISEVKFPVKRYGLLNAVLIAITFPIMDSDLSFELFSLQGIAAAVMMFGTVGMYTIKSTYTEVYAVLAGGLAAAASMYAVGKMMQGISNLQVDGTMQIKEAIGERGQVHSRIRPDEAGEISVAIQGTLRNMPARAKDKSLLIPTGKFIKVVDVISSTLIVEELTEEDTCLACEG